MLDISNAGTIDASDINITDTLSSDLDINTVAVVLKNDNQDSCACSGGDAGDGIDADFATGAPTAQAVKITGLTAVAGKHNCVTFQVDIK